jgi:hypothetical protein
MLGRPALVLGMALLFDVATLSRAPAQTGEASPALSRATRVVELVVVGGNGEAVGIIGTVSELLGGLGVATEAHAVATPTEVLGIPRGSALARVQVDLRDSAEVVIVAEGRGLTAARRTLHRDRSATVTREEVAQAVESAVQAHLFQDPQAAPSSADAGDGASPEATVPPDGSSASSPASAAPQDFAPPPASAFAPAAERPAAVSATVSPVAFDVSPLAGVGWFASGMGPVTDVGGDVSLAWRRGWHPTVSLSARAVLPFGHSADEVTGHASVFASRVLAGMEIVRSSWMMLVPGLGGGADVLWVQPQSPSLAPSVLAESTTRVDPIATAFVEAHFALAANVSFTCMVAGDVDLAPPRYVVVQGSAVDPALAPWRVRPTFLAGFTFTALGQPAFVRGVAR